MRGTGNSTATNVGDLVSLTIRTGFARWPWPRWWRPFRDNNPGIVELITGGVGDPGSALNADGKADEALAAVRAAGVQVFALLGDGRATAANAPNQVPAAGRATPPASGQPDADAGTADPGDAPVVSLIREAINQFNGGGNHALRFPRTRLVARLATLEPQLEEGEEPVNALMRALHRYWERLDTDDGQRFNVVQAVLAAAPNPVQMVTMLITGLVRRHFQLWFWGVPWAGPACGWLRRQRRHWLDSQRRASDRTREPQVGFKTFVQRLTPRWRYAAGPDLKVLIVKAFCEDLRIAYQPRLWNPRTWDRCYRPVLILDGLADDKLPVAFAAARTEAEREGSNPDPLLLVLVPKARRAKHSSASREVGKLGDPENVAVRGPVRPWLALATSFTSTLGALGVVALLAVLLAAQVPTLLEGKNAIGATMSPAPVTSSAVVSPPSPKPTSPPSKFHGGQLTIGCVSPQAKEWYVGNYDEECVGYSNSVALVFQNQYYSSKDQNKQDQRVAYDEDQIFKEDQIANSLAASGGRPEVGLVYFAGLTEGAAENFDSGQAEELEGLLAAQVEANVQDGSGPVLEIFVANGGSEMKQAPYVAGLLVKLFARNVNMLGVVGLDRSTGDVLTAVKTLTSHHIPVLTTTLSADYFSHLSTYYFSLSRTNSDEAQLILNYIKNTVTLYFKQLRSKYYSAGQITPTRVVVYIPSDVNVKNPKDPDYYLITLMQDLEHYGPRILPSAEKPQVTSSLKQGSVCGAATVVIYDGRHDLTSGSKQDDFSKFMRAINDCPQRPFVIGDDGVTRFIADPAQREAGLNGDWPISYVTKGLSILDTRDYCLQTSTVHLVAAGALRTFCGTYAEFVKGLKKTVPGVQLPWTGERVGLAYDAAKMFLRAEDVTENLTRAGVPTAFEQNTYVGVTGTVKFSATDHVGSDGTSLAIVRIALDGTDSPPVCAVTSAVAATTGQPSDSEPNPQTCVNGLF